MPQALGAGPTEVWRSGVLTALRKKRRGDWLGRTYGEVLLCISWHILPQQQNNQIRKKFDCTLRFQSLCPSLTPYLHFMQERMSTIIYLNIGPNKRWASMGTNTIFYNKTLFEKIYITLSMKMNASPLHRYHCIVLHTYEYGHVWKRTQAHTLNPKGSFTRDASR